MTLRTPGGPDESENEVAADTQATGGAVFYHGGALAAARARFPDAPEPWFDLSTGINPVAYPVGAIDAAAWTRLPEAEDVRALEDAAAGAYGVPDAAAVAAAPGTQALIQALPGLLGARRVGVLGPTYAEHARCFRRAGAEVVTLDTLDGAELFDAVVVVNPNNPDGRLVSPGLLAALAAALSARGGALIVDEAFMDVLAPEASVAAAVPAAGGVVLRSFGKTYGLAGLRLGFAVARPEVAATIRDTFGPWAVSGPAIRIGERALRDRAWLRDATARLRDDAARLDDLLARIGMRVSGGTPLFRLAEHPRASRLFEALGAAGVLTRPFRQRPDQLRFGLPGPAEWDALADRLGYAARVALDESRGLASTFKHRFEQSR